jgi:Ser/Thr protein kinase RdoA (MazF antagonist)
VATVLDLLDGVGQSWRLARHTLRPIAPTHPPVQRWLRLGEQLLPAAERAILEANLHQLRPVVAHAGLWPAHVLVERATVTGLLDFGAAVVTTPLLDVAQLVTRFAGWTAEHAELVLASYSGAFLLTPEERRTLPAMAALDLVVEAARLLRFGYAEVLPPASVQATAAKAGALAMLDSMEAVTGAVVRAAKPMPRANQRAIARRQARERNKRS